MNKLIKIKKQDFKNVLCKKKLYIKYKLYIRPIKYVAVSIVANLFIYKYYNFCNSKIFINKI